MATVKIDGLTTRYEVLGSGPPLLMYAPAGFNATLEAWSTTGIYAKFKPLEHLPKNFTCIVFDRRECGQSGGRIERLTWNHYVRQGKGLLDHLGIKRAHLMGGCMGCPPVEAFGAAHPETVASMVLFWPVGGAKYRIASHQRFAEHLGFVQRESLAAVVALIERDGQPFGADPRGGPWASAIKNDRTFAAAFAAQNVEHYKLIITAMARTLFDRDTAPGAEPEDLMRLDIPALIVPGNDASHTTSAARYLAECLPRADYWDVSVADQTEETVAPRIAAFLESVTL
jgi:pimeloyl-ACP methyl ester carboxylesterase